MKRLIYVAFITLMACGDSVKDVSIRDHLENGEFKMASQLIFESEKGKLAPKDVLQTAQYFSERTAYNVSIPLFELLLEIDPENAFGKLLLANNLRQEKKYNDAVLLYDEVVQHDSLRFIVLPERARLYIHLNEFDKARADIAEAKNLQPKYFASYLAEGLLEYAHGRQQEALDLFDIAEELDPGVSAEASLYAGFIMVNNNINYDALSKFTRAISIGKNIDKGFAFINRGVCQINLRDTGFACQDWDSALHYMPEEAGKYLKEYCQGVKRPKGQRKEIR